MQPGLLKARGRMLKQIFNRAARAGQRLCASYRAVILLMLLVGFLATAHGQTAPLDMTPEEHRPPSASDVERIELAHPNSAPPDSNRTAAEATCLLPPLNLLTSSTVAATELNISNTVLGRSWLLSSTWLR